MTSDMQLHDVSGIARPVSAWNNTNQQDPSTPFGSNLQLLVLVLILIPIAYQCFHYFTCELVPFGSGLKPLPGPRSTIPYAGRVHDVDRMQAWTAMHKFSKQYGGLFSCTLGGETHIWVSREDVAQDLLVRNAELSSSRGDLGAYPGVTEDHKYLPLLGYTEHWHRQRRFCHAMMTRAAKYDYFGHITVEMKRLIHELSMNPQDFHTLTHLFCARISSRLAYGTADRASEHSTNAEVFISQLGPSGPIPNLMPFLRYFPEWLAPGQKGVRLRQEKEAKLWTDMFYRSKSGFEQSKETNTYTGASLTFKELGSDSNLLFANEEEAKCAVGMLCTVAIFTIGGPAIVFIVAMILHPEWQGKVRAEIEDVVGEGEMVDLKHSPQLPTLRAAIKECVRWKSTVPLGVPRLLTSNYTFDGYHFPKGAIVHAMDLAMSRDPERYVDPDIYNPDRWLNESSPNFRGPLTEHPRLKGHHIFGRGKRVCPGQDFAEAELLVFCGNLVKFFDLGPKIGANGEKIWPGSERWTTDVIGGPLPFECEIKVRHGLEENIETMSEQIQDQID